LSFYRTDGKIDHVMLMRGYLGLALYAAIALAQSAGTFTATGNMTTPRAGHVATLLTSGKVFIAGGTPDDTPVNSELYDPASGKFTSTMMTLGHLLLPDGRYLVFTGPGSAETYDPSTGSLTATGDMVGQLYSTRAITLLQDGRVFVAGYPTSQIYDPQTNTFAATQPYAVPAPSILQTATLLADGRVLLTGAVNVCYQLQCRDPGTGWTELYDPRTGTFNIAGNMNWWNNIYTATLLVSGKVLFVGGDSYNGIPWSGEIFDPSSGTFKVIEAPQADLQYSAATPLPDGTVLITGSGLCTNGTDQTAELYSPESGKFSTAGNMITARSLHTATLLPDGTVLIAGGVDCVGNAMASAEIYRPAMLTPAPVLFSLTEGISQGVIWHSDTGQIASSEHPAVSGDMLSMYTTSLSSGGVVPPQLAIGGRLAEVLYFGSAPGYPGFNQLNIRVPSGIAPRAAVPVRLTYFGRTSNEVTVAVGNP
jgi:uncharacterized protein (TIGR03437 family)